MSTTAPSSGASGDSPAAGERYALRRLVRLWLVVAAIEALLYLLLYRSSELKGLYELPALGVLVTGVVLSWHSRWRRPGHDRRRADRRHRSEPPPLD